VKEQCLLLTKIELFTGDISPVGINPDTAGILKAL